MHSKIVKSTILVVYINFSKIAKFNYLKEVNVHSIRAVTVHYFEMP